MLIKSKLQQERQKIRKSNIGFCSVQASKHIAIHVERTTVWNSLAWLCIAIGRLRLSPSLSLDHLYKHPHATISLCKHYIGKEKYVQRLCINFIFDSGNVQTFDSIPEETEQTRRNGNRKSQNETATTIETMGACLFYVGCVEIKSFPCILYLQCQEKYRVSSSLLNEYKP